MLYQYIILAYDVECYSFIEEIVYLAEATFQATVASLMSESSCASSEVSLIIQLHVYNSLRLQAQ